MRKLILTVSVIICATCLKAQTDSYFKIRQKIQLAFPEINLENKLLAFNIWQIDNLESREANKSFEKAYEVYQSAKLKGGAKGLVVVDINQDNLSSTAVITLKRDGVNKSISFSLDDFGNELDPNLIKNRVFDSNGNEVYKDLASTAVFHSINQLITR